MIKVRKPKGEKQQSNPSIFSAPEQGCVTTCGLRLFFCVTHHDQALQEQFAEQLNTICAQIEHTCAERARSKNIPWRASWFAGSLSTLLREVELPYMPGMDDAPDDADADDTGEDTQ